MKNVAQQFAKYLRTVDTPTSLKVFLLLKNNEWDQIADLSIDPAHYLTADSYFIDAVCVSFLRKLQDLPCTYDKKAAAVEKFLASEKKCCSTNTFLTRFLNNGPFEGSEFGLSEFFDSVKEKIRLVLGPAPDLPDGRFGPGATATDPSVYSTVAHKCSSDPSVTNDALGVLPDWARTAWGRSVVRRGAVINVVRGNHFISVPKTAKTDRGICIEPSMNVFYQLGVGKLIRQRLREFAGIDLQHGKELHMALAQKASYDDSLATIDLSNASDTVSYNLVKLLLPKAWFDILNSLRCPTTKMDGKIYYLSKFSSMGNGFTFELETLIFWAITKSCCSEDKVYAYGDDIICPREKAALVVKALEICGFEVNTSKTFTSGPFRESCGGDFFNGIFVRPHFLEKLPREPQEWISLANGVRRLACIDDIWDPRFLAWWHSVLDAIPTGVRKCRGPTSLGDLCLHDSVDHWHTKIRDQIRYVRCYCPADIWVWSWRRFPASAVLAAALYGIRQVNGTHGGPGFSPRHAVVGYATRWVAVPA